jgi:ABC-2 type transport system ATP-binding protein
MKDMIKVCHLKHYFGEKVVLDNIDLQIKTGEIFGLLGPSGAGKTTLIKILTGQLQPSEGSAELFQKSSMKLNGNDYKNIGIMMDQFGLYERLNCYDNLKLFSMLNGNPAERIMEALDKVGLKSAAKTVVSNLSKGMRSRLVLARAILGTPKILFLDEPTSGLDPATAEEIHKLILEEKEKGTTIFLTTHNMAEAEKLCDNVALLNDGKIVEYGNPKETCRKYNYQKKLLLHLYDGTDIELQHDKSSVEKLVKYLENGELETIHSTEPNLETVFMELTGRKLE